MKYRNHQRVGAFGCVMTAVLIASYSGPFALIALPASTVALGWFFGKLVLLPARRQSAGQRSIGRADSTRVNFWVLLGIVIGIALPALLRQVSVALAAGVIANYVAVLGGGLFFLSLSETE